MRSTSRLVERVQPCSRVDVRLLSVLVATLLVGAWTSEVRADVAGEAPRISDAPSSRTCRLCGNHGWELALSVPLWIPMVTGSFAIHEADSPDTDFGKRLRADTSIRFAMMGELRVRVGAVAAVVDTFGASLTTGVGFTFADGDIGHIDMSGGFLRMAASYRIPALELGRLKNPLLLSFAPYAGTRFYRIGLGLESKRIDRSDVRKWWDPIVGIELDLDFRVGLVLRTEFDAGGFGVGSETAWWLASSLEYGFLDWLALSLGWTFARFERDSSAFDVRLSMTGPRAILSFYIQ